MNYSSLFKVAHTRGAFTMNYNKFNLKAILAPLVVAMLSFNVQAVVNSQPDCEPDPAGPPSTCGHPQSGFSAVTIPGAGVFPVCSNTLIYKSASLIAVLTAGHCHRLGLDPYPVSVNFDSKPYNIQAGIPFSTSLLFSGAFQVDVNRYVPVDMVIVKPEFDQVLANLVTLDPLHKKDRSHDLALLLIKDPTNIALFNTYWNIDPAQLPSLKYLDTIKMPTLKTLDVVQSSSGLNEIQYGQGTSPAFTQVVTISGERGVAKSQFRSMTPEGWILSGDNVNDFDEGFGGATNGDSGSGLYINNQLVGVHSAGIRSVWSTGPRIDTPGTLSFICKTIDDNNGDNNENPLPVVCNF